MKRLFAILIILSLLLSLCSCPRSNRKIYLDGVLISEYSIVYSEDSLDYNKRAAEYLRDEIFSRTGYQLALVTDATEPASHEIVVGQTRRAISETLSVETEGLEFAILADGGSVAMEADAFAIAGAAYYFIDTYLAQGNSSATLPTEVLVREPITKETTSVILLIGDGMGVEQTRLFEYLENSAEYSDGEDLFYGYMLPYHGYSRTDSLSGTTDSAAGGTALAAGYKTYNGYVGLKGDGTPATSLVELFMSLNKATAVMSTESATGATPASFSAHTDSRSNSSDIIDDQFELELDGTHFSCGFDYYDQRYMKMIENNVITALEKMEANPNGFFLMYEEAHIDKHSHSNDMENTFLALIRFNQVIARFMEYALYHPGTLVLITADHETGDLRSDGGTDAPVYHSEDHSSADVPVFAFGAGAELFGGVTVENVQIPKTLASIIGVSDFGDRESYPALVKNQE